MCPCIGAAAAAAAEPYSVGAGAVQDVMVAWHYSGASYFYQILQYGSWCSAACDGGLALLGHQLLLPNYSVGAGAVQDVKMVAWHPDGDVLASASYDDTIKLWIESDDEWICAQTLVGTHPALPLFP